MFSRFSGSVYIRVLFSWFLFLLFVFPKLGTLCLTSLLRNLLESKFVCLTFFLVPLVAWLFRSGAESFVSRSQDSPRSDAADLCCGRRKPSRLAFRSDLNGRVDLYTIKAANITKYAVFCIFSIEKSSYSVYDSSKADFKNSKRCNYSKSPYFHGLERVLLNVKTISFPKSKPTKTFIFFDHDSYLFLVCQSWIAYIRVSSAVGPLFP